MPTRTRIVDRGTAAARRQRQDIGRELGQAREGRGLSARAVGRALGCSHGKVVRVERGESPDVSLLTLNQLAAIVGLDLSVRLYPGGNPLRDAGHVRLLERLRARLHTSLGWAIEVPLPQTGDLRAWDALIRGAGWRQAVEAETSPHDAQALARRLELKRRDGDVDGLVLLLPDTRRSRAFLREARDVLRPGLPLDSEAILAALARGNNPGGSGIVVL